MAAPAFRPATLSAKLTPVSVKSRRRSSPPCRVSARASAVETSTAVDVELDESWKFVMSKQGLLESPNRRAAGIIDGKNLALFFYKNEVYCTTGTCPHLGIALAGGDIKEEGGEPVLVCSQHKSSWSMRDGETQEWLPDSGSFMNRLQRVVSKPCPITTYNVKVDANGDIYVQLA